MMGSRKYTSVVLVIQERSHLCLVLCGRKQENEQATCPQRMFINRSPGQDELKEKSRDQGSGGAPSSAGIHRMCRCRRQGSVLHLSVLGLQLDLMSLDVFEWFCDFFLSREMSMDRLLIWCSPTYLPENLV